MTKTKKTILFMDIVDSTKLWSIYDNKIIKCIKKLHKIIELKLKKYTKCLHF